MASNTNKFDLNALVAQLQKQLAQRNSGAVSFPPAAAAAAAAAAPISGISPSSSVPPLADWASLAHTLQSNGSHLQSSSGASFPSLAAAAAPVSGGSSSSSVPPLADLASLAQVASRTSPSQLLPANDPVRQQQVSSLLESAKLLASINPNLASMVMEQALSLMPTNVQGQHNKAAFLSSLQSISSGISSLSNSTPTQSVSTASETKGASSDMAADYRALNAEVKHETDKAPKPPTDVSHPKRSANGGIKVTFSEGTAVPSLSSDGKAIKSVAEVTGLPSSPPPIVGLPILQTWDLAKLGEFSNGKSTTETFTVQLLLILHFYLQHLLESYAQQFEACQQPVPNVVRIVIEDVQRREKRKLDKRLANRKSASAARARKQQLIDELTASNSRLRRFCSVLAYLPDACIAIDISGKIKFCSSVKRILGYDEEDLEGRNIQDIVVPRSKDKIQGLIQSLLSVNFPMLEVQLDRDNVGDSRENPNDLSSESSEQDDKNATKLKSESTLSSSNENASDESNEPPAKKLKKEMKESTSSEDMNVDDVMGESVTANNAGAKLSSLMHHPEKEPGDSKNDAVQGTKNNEPSLRRHTRRKSSIPPEKVKDSLDSGYKNSSEGSVDNSSNSGSSDFDQKNGKCFK